jgi:protein-L-isoaspartate(D-aspartate) O-methyltransferase
MTTDHPVASKTAFRNFFARLVVAQAKRRVPRLEEAFASVPREVFAGAGPWWIWTPSGYISTETDDPDVLYQDFIVGVDLNRKINIGLPSLHARALAELDINQGDTIVQVGTGTGYYTAILGYLVGSKGKVIGFEINEELAGRAAINLQSSHNVSLQMRSGAADLPQCDVLYVNASVPGPLPQWLDALSIEGRLLFPLTPANSFGGMLLVTRVKGAVWPARFLFRVEFISCEGEGVQDQNLSDRLATAIARGDWQMVRSIHIGTKPDETCWHSGNGWWLSKSGPR